MKYIRTRGTTLWMRYQNEHGKWVSRSTGCRVGDETGALRCLEAVRHGIERKRAAIAKSGNDTVRAYAKRWLEERKALDVDWTADRSRLDHHILPAIGDMKIADVKLRDIDDMIRKIRTTKKLAPRTVRNIYSVVAALFRDARLAGLVEASPCGLSTRQLGEVVDKDAEWRDQAVFTLPEAVTLISDARIPEDRRVVYGLELLAGVRTGEAAALRWKHWNETTAILGQMTVVHSYNTRKNAQKKTKTKSAKCVPVHPTLAEMLTEWRAGGWPAMFGREPGPEDLIVPLPPDAAARRRSRSGEPFRGYDYSGKRWREDDLPALGWRARRHYDMRATFITLALEAGADPIVIESRVTHTKRTRSAFDGYNRGKQWEKTCREVLKLPISRDTVVTVDDSSSENVVEAVGVEAARKLRSGRHLAGISTEPRGRDAGSELDVTNAVTALRYSGFATALRDFVAPYTTLAAGEMLDILEARARGGRGR